MPKYGRPRVAGEFRGLDLALGAALAEAARHQNAIHVLEIGGGVLALEDLGFDPFEIDLHLVGDAAMNQRLAERLIGILEPGIFADHGDGHFAIGIGDGVGDLPPALEVGLGRVRDAERGQHFAVETFRVVGDRHVIDALHVERLDHGFGADIAEQRDLAPLVPGQRPVGAAQQDVGLDADRSQLLDRVLGGLGLELAGARDIGHQRQMNESGRPARQLVAELADRFEERQALDVAHRAADLAQHEIDAFIAGGDERLDGVGDVRDDLHGGAEIIAAPLLADNLLIDAPGGDVVGLAGGASGKALVMAEIEVGLGAVVGDEHLAVLIGAHGSRVDIEIGVELA